MATFYGGEQLVEKGYVVQTFNNVSSGDVFTLYTVPSGHYLVLDFAWAGNVLNFPTFYGNSNANFNIRLEHPDITLGAVGLFANVKDLSLDYMDSYIQYLYKDIIVDEGFKFTTFASGIVVGIRAEIRFRLYKKPWQ